MHQYASCAVDDKIAQRCRSLIASMKEEKEALLSDLAKLKISKLAADSLGAQQGARLDNLEKDLVYYQAREGERGSVAYEVSSESIQVQLSKSVAERDHVLFENEQLKRKALDAEDGQR